MRANCASVATQPLLDKDIQDTIIANMKEKGHGHYVNYAHFLSKAPLEHLHIEQFLDDIGAGNNLPQLAAILLLGRNNVTSCPTAS